MNGLPSILELERSMKALEAAPRTPDLEKAITTCRGLLRWVKHAGTPPVEEPTEKQRAQSLSLIPKGGPYHRDRPPMPQSWDGVRAAQRQHHAAGAASTTPPAPAPVKVSRGLGKAIAAEPPRNSMSGLAVLAHFRWGHAQLARAIEQRGFPKPIATAGRLRYFDRAAVMEWQRANATAEAAAPPPAPRERPSRARDRGPKPEGTETMAELMERLNRTQPWFYQRMSDTREGSEPFPRPSANWGPVKVWNTEEVNAWVARRIAKTAEQGNQRFVIKPLGGKS